MLADKTLAIFGLCLLVFLTLSWVWGLPLCLSDNRLRCVCVFSFVKGKEMTPSAKLFHYRESHEHPPWARGVLLLLIGGGLSVSCLNSNNPVYIAAVAKLSVWTMSTFGGLVLRQVNYAWFCCCTHLLRNVLWHQFVKRWNIYFLAAVADV